VNANEIINNLWFDRHKWIVTAEPGIVDEESEQFILCNARLNLGNVAGVGEISIHHFCMYTKITPHTFGQCFQAFATTRHQNEVVAVARKSFREYRANPG
jgi:hypothetical protein